MGPGNSTADESNGVQSSTIVYDFLISMEITKQWQVQCVDINKLYNISCYDRKVVVVVALLFYVHGKHLRSCRDGQLT